jgi:catechol 2,3-dioxygenase-like lactoylglutathione lyase family enzyme
MAGIVFFGTEKICELEEFYTNVLGMRVWLRQADCIIMKHENMLLGFCARTATDCSGTITFFYNNVEEVDAMYGRLRDRADGVPQKNGKYSIYHFFACDPEQRLLEFQCFLHPVDV